MHEEKPKESPPQLPASEEHQEHRVRSLLHCNTRQKEFSLKEDLNVHTNKTHTAEKEFTCDICGNPLASESNLKIHIERFHSVAKPFGWETCGKSFSQASDVEEHREQVCFGEESFKCGICATECADRKSLWRHTREIHDGRGAAQCELCHRGFKRKRNLKRHIKNIHSKGGKPFLCRLCGEMVTKESDVKKHRDRICTGGEKSFKCGMCAVPCEICEAEYATKENLRKHALERHFINETYRCKLCQKGFYRRENLKRHVEIIRSKGDKESRSQLCWEVITKESELEKHRDRLCTASREESFNCGMCAAVFTTDANRIRHIEGVHFGKPHWCEYCRRGYSQRHYLKKHTEMFHSGEGQFRCELCAKTFSQLSDLERHQRRVCAVEKPFACEMCKRRFVYKSTLTRHTVTFHGRILFKCEVPKCGVRFSLCSDLEKHYRLVHSKERRSASEGRSSKFTIESILNMPTKRSRTEENPFKCEVCRVAFSNFVSLTEHTLIHAARGTHLNEIEFFSAD